MGFRLMSRAVLSFPRFRLDGGRDFGYLTIVREDRAGSASSASSTYLGSEGFRVQGLGFRVGFRVSGIARRITQDSPGGAVLL